MRIVWGAFALALAVYLIAAHVVGSRLADDLGLNDRGLLVFKVALGVVAIVFLVQAYSTRKSRLRLPNTNYQPGFIERIPWPIFPSPDYRLISPSALYFTATVPSILLAHCTGVAGLILFLISGEFITLYACVITSAIAQYFFRPKIEELERLAMDMKSLQDSD